MRKKLFKALLMISILSTSLIHRPPAQASFLPDLSGDFISSLSSFDITRRDNILREMGREFDPFKPGGNLADIKKAAFEVRYCLIRGGCDFTRDDIKLRQIVEQEVKSCFVKGGCSPSIP